MVSRTVVLLAVVATVPATVVSCAAVAGIDAPVQRSSDAGITDVTIGDVDAATPDAAPPRSCGDIHASGVTADGTYTIDPDGSGPNPPFAVYCNQMSTVEPTEYLELPANVDAGLAGSNISGFAPGGNCCECQAITLAFTKVRLNVQSLAIVPSDRAFAFFETDAGCASFSPYSPITNTQFGYAAAGSCVNYGDTSGRGNVDLTGTPFHVAPSSVFAPTADSGVGCIATLSTDRKRVDLQGGGYCGLCEAADDTGGLVLAFDPTDH